MRNFIITLVCLAGCSRPAVQMRAMPQMRSIDSGTCVEKLRTDDAYYVVVCDETRDNQAKLTVSQAEYDSAVVGQQFPRLNLAK